MFAHKIFLFPNCIKLKYRASKFNNILAGKQRNIITTGSRGAYRLAAFVPDAKSV